jgi:hypothetical protein
MHLGLWPFVPHNQISAQESPVPLPRFEMAPRFKILMFSGSKKWTQIYYPFHSKVPASESAPGSPFGPLWREIPAYRTFLHLSLYISFYLSLRVPGNGAPSIFPNRVPMERDTLSPEPFYSFIHVRLPESPKRSPPAYGEKHKVTIHGALRSRKAYIQWGAAWLP